MRCEPKPHFWTQHEPEENVKRLQAEVPGGSTEHPRVEEMKSYERELDRMNGFMDDVKLRMAEQQKRRPCCRSC